MKKGTYSSWGMYPYYPQIAHDCMWRDELTTKLKGMVEIHGSTLAYGNGRSYGDSCFAHSDNVLSTRCLNKIILADWETGKIICESGITFEEIIDIALPKGWFLPVTPGTKFVTLGGAIANDIHGKNHHHKGTFGCHIKQFCLIRADQKELICSNQKNTSLFQATIGGLGLTGIIKWAEIQLIPVNSSEIESTAIRFDSLEEFFTISKELDTQYEYSATWIDCLAKNNSIGKGIYFAGNHTKKNTLEIKTKKNKTLPFTLPISAVNSLTLRAFNYLYFRKHKTGRKNILMPYDKFFYPLDGVLHWNRIYGKKGFQQYQCIIPEKNAYNGIKTILKLISDHKCGSFLAVLKRCGDIPSPGLLSFPMPGISLALDFPQNNKLVALFSKLDEIVRETQGRLYPAKDAHMTGSDFRLSYPSWEKVEALRDPALNSRFWKRVTD
ncbi:FAD/FMN-containing dehydrogenase [gamma proteobacterium IMCC1989]|nr:FAD/FMN-containing dehydrogenase [gamma proteobacterium IMCC1989]